MPPEAEASATDLESGDSSELFRLLDSLPVGFFVLDRHGTVLRMNSTASQHLRRRATEAIGLDLFGEVLPELQEVRREYRAQIAANAVNLTVSAVIRDESDMRSLHVTIRSVYVAGENLGIVLLQDRTPAAEEERHRKLAESLSSLGELAAGLAHEVNNPLASIKSFGQLLAREVTTDQQRNALELIVQESERIARTVEKLVAFARQQGAGGRELVNLSRIVQQVVEVRRYSLEAAGIEIRLDLDASISSVMGEPGALQQVILNLVNRAEGDLADRGAGRMLIVRTRESSEGVMLYVVDNGPGIPRELLPHLFDSYGPASESQNLELATAARIVRDHGGYIFAESEAGRGAAFFVRLPRSGGPPLTPQAELTSAPTPPVAAPLRVLVADDEPTLRLAITLFLKRRGHEVTQASDAYEAYRLATEQQFDVALVDARMPGDGLVLLEQLEAMPSLQGRTALMTGDLGRARTSQGITTGRPYLVKPFDMNEAVTLLEKLGRGVS
jgi:two-component system, cell cycle sensor histidine kinase and response regulator CckA